MSHVHTHVTCTYTQYMPYSEHTALAHVMKHSNPPVWWWVWREPSSRSSAILGKL